MMFRFLRRFDRREFGLILALAILGPVALVFVTFAAPKIKEYRTLSAAETALSRTAGSDVALDSQLVALSRDVESLQQRLHGDMASMPEKQIEAHVIGKLQRLSWKHDIQLVGIEPAAGETIDSFRELLFQVNLVGNYFEMYEWIRDVSNELGFVLIKQYEMRPVDAAVENSRLTVKLTMATYRTLQP